MAEKKTKPEIIIKALRDLVAYYSEEYMWGP